MAYHGQSKTRHDSFGARFFRSLVCVSVIAGCCLLAAAMLWGLAKYAGKPAARSVSAGRSISLTRNLEQYAADQTQDALSGMIALPQAVPKQEYRLSDEDLIAPAPNPNCYGDTTDPAVLQDLLDRAAPLLDGQSFYFTPNQPLLPGSSVHYYFDDTILVITWKEAINQSVYTFSEVKLLHGSQLRRFLAGGEFGSDKQFATTEMAKSVNAVVASSGDFYKFRYAGIVVYGNQVRRVNTNRADTCLINEEGDLLFLYQNEKMTKEEAQAYVDENQVRFSLTFGPVLIDNGVRCEPKNYDIGQPNSYSSRAALCQMGKLHYLLVNVNPEGDNPCRITVHQLAEQLMNTGCDKAYTLDGGQTAVIAMDGKLINPVLFGTQRKISDIIYFATAIPEGGQSNG